MALTDNTSLGRLRSPVPLLEETLSDGSEAEDLEAERSETERSETGLGRVGADGAYDTFDVYEVISDHGATPAIPPQKNAKIKKHGNSESMGTRAVRLFRAMRRSDTSASTGATSTGATSGSEPTATIGGAIPSAEPV